MRQKLICALIMYLSVWLILSLKPLPTLACSCGDRWQFGFLGSEGKLPSNARGLLWHGTLKGEADKNAKLPVLIQKANGKLVPVEFEPFMVQPNLRLWLFRPAGGFEPQQTYTFTTSIDVDSQAQTWQVSLANAPLVSMQAPIALRSGRPSLEWTHVSAGLVCWQEVPAVQLPVIMQLPVEIQPYKAQLYYETWVDGKLWHPITGNPATSPCFDSKPGVSWNGKQAEDSLFTVCYHGKHRAGLEPGMHTVEMRAILPGTDFSIRTGPLQVHMQCPFPS